MGRRGVRPASARCGRARPWLQPELGDDRSRLRALTWCLLLRQAGCPRYRRDHARRRALCSGLRSARTLRADAFRGAAGAIAPLTESCAPWLAVGEVPVEVPGLAVERAGLQRAVVDAHDRHHLGIIAG